MGICHICALVRQGSVCPGRPAGDNAAMQTRNHISYFRLIAALAFASAARADAFDWSNNEIQYLHGSGYQMPGNNNDIDYSIVTVTHADGWAYGRNFFFMDTLFSEAGEPSQVNLYGELYSSLSFSKLSGRDLSFGWIKDLNMTGGVNLGENMNSRESGVRVILYGASLDLQLPGFNFFNVDFLRYDTLEPVRLDSSWQITPSWQLPFTIAGTKWSFEGFADFIGKNNSGSARTALAQPQLRLDVGDLYGYGNHLYLGVEYQYWHNKFGIKGLHESLPQALLVWKF